MAAAVAVAALVLCANVAVAETIGGNDDCVAQPSLSLTQKESHQEPGEFVGEVMADSCYEVGIPGLFDATVLQAWSKTVRNESDEQRQSATLDLYLDKNYQEVVKLAAVEDGELITDATFSEYGWSYSVATNGLAFPFVRLVAVRIEDFSCGKRAIGWMSVSVDESANLTIGKFVVATGDYIVAGATPRPVAKPPVYNPFTVERTMRKYSGTQDLLLSLTLGGNRRSGPDLEIYIDFSYLPLIQINAREYIETSFGTTNRIHLLHCGNVCGEMDGWIDMVVSDTSVFFSDMEITVDGHRAIELTDVNGASWGVLECDDGVIISDPSVAFPTNSTDIAIPSQIAGRDVVGIRGAAFWGYPVLGSCDIPPSVRTVGRDAFDYCPSLTNVAIAATTVCDRYAFDDQQVLTQYVAMTDTGVRLSETESARLFGVFSPYEFQDEGGVRVTESGEGVASLCVYLGIVPSRRRAADGVLDLRFEKPTLRISGFSPDNDSLVVNIAPADGTEQRVRPEHYSYFKLMGAMSLADEFHALDGPNFTYGGAPWVVNGSLHGTSCRFFKVAVELR